MPIFNSFVGAEVAVVPVGVAEVVTVGVDLEQPTRTTPAINMIASDTNRSFFTVVPPLCDLVYLPLVRQCFVTL
jgi:hypothetical protein